METEDLKEELTNFNGNGHDRAKNSLTNFFSLIIYNDGTNFAKLQRGLIFNDGCLNILITFIRARETS